MSLADVGSRHQEIAYSNFKSGRRNSSNMTWFETGVKRFYREHHKHNR
jgi:hypothetical protein